MASNTQSAHNTFHFGPTLSMNFVFMTVDDDGSQQSNNGTSIPAGFPDIMSFLNPIFGGLGGPSVPFGFPPNAAQQPGQFRNMQDWMDHLFRHHQPRGAPPASKSIIDKLPRVKVSHQQVEDEKLDCAVCKDNFQENDTALLLPCRHYYHEDCIKPWLSQHCTCPVCRYELPVDDEEYEKQRKERMAQRNVQEDVLFQNPQATDVAMRDVEKEAEELANELMETQQRCEKEHMFKESCALLQGEDFVSLSCGHKYHAECLESMLHVSGDLPYTQTLKEAGNFTCPSCHKDTFILDSVAID